MSKNEFSMTAIGVIRTGRNGFLLEMKTECIPALKGLAGFSHINVLWWCHLLDDEMYRTIMEADQPYKNSPAELGIFATRSPLRPNPIALSVASVTAIDLKKGIIIVPYIDAEDGTPVLDIKPYHPSCDRIKKTHVPEWCSHWPQWVEDSAAFDWAAEFVNAR